MGRAVLLSVMLVTTIFATILISLNRNIGGVSQVLIRNQLLKEAENVSDFALRNAIRNAGSVEFLDTYLAGGFFTDEKTFTQSFTNYRIGNCSIDSIRYSYVNSQANYKVRSFVRASLQGVSVSKDAEMSFNYPFLSLGSSKPNAFYLEMERLILFPWLFQNNNRLPDSSNEDEPYIGYTEGWSLISATIPWGGAFSRYCTKFNGFDNYINVPPLAEQDTSWVERIDTDDSFSLLIFAKLDKNINKNNQGTLIWIPSEPSDNVMRQKPCAGIWFAKSDSKIHFAVTQSNSNMLEVTKAFTPTAVIFNWWLGFLQIFNIRFYEYPWSSYGLTYNAGTLKAYIDGTLVGTSTGTNIPAYPSMYGMSIGRKDLRGTGFSNSDRMYFCGVMDQSGMHDRALMDAEMKSWHNGVMSSTLIKYIRD